MGDDEGWTTHTTRKSRRQKSWLPQPDAFGGRMPAGFTAQRSGQRTLPLWLRRGYEPPTPPCVAGGVGKGGGKQDNAVYGGPPWFFKGDQPAKDTKILCGNPNCPGLGGKRSFKYLYRVGHGQFGHHCMACHTPWKESWEAQCHGWPPPFKGTQKGGK